MSADLLFLTLTLALALLQILWASAARTQAMGEGALAWNMGPRDEAPVLDLRAQRLKRAQDNLFETLPLFAAAVLVAHAAGRSGGLSAAGAGAYFLGRLVYAPLYAYGVPLVRSLAWIFAALGLLAVLAADLGL